MPEFSNLADLMKFLEDTKTEILQNDVAEMAKGKMRDHVQTDVYDAYDPLSYERTGTLKDNVNSEMVDADTVEITDVYEDYEDGVYKDVTKIVETGKGYTWGYTRDLNQVIGARPFIKNTKEEIMRDNLHVETFKEALKEKGIKTE